MNKLVQMLLFCYINLLLSRKENSIVAKFLLSAIHDELDEGGLDNRELDSRDEEDAERKKKFNKRLGLIVYFYHKLKHV
jgi:hypothetical protein